MGNYIPNIDEEQKEMLNSLGMSSFDELYKDVPEKLMKNETFSIPDGKSEQEVLSFMKKIAEKNKVYDDIFRGAGAYNHFIPAMVNNVISKENFQTAYTPYQAEVSQGVLQNIFEYQTMICELTGMEASNAGVYDGASAAAEAVNMIRTKKKNKILVSETSPKSTIDVIKTYAFGNGVEVEIVPQKDYLTDIEKLKGMLEKDVCGIFLQSPNYYGSIENVEEIANLVHEAGGKVILGVNPMTLGLLKTPRELGADIATGDAQPLGLPMYFGGPYAGFMATTSKDLRKLPGRIVGETHDKYGNRAFVLTLQAREQHIRREKASSNICSNEALCCLAVAVYLSEVGKKGLKKVAINSMSNAHYLASELEKIGFNVENKSEFFHEFVTSSDKDTKLIDKKLSDNSILGGLPLDENRILWCCTEMNSKEDIDKLISVLKED
ncbi:MAG: aminomethyl-transferring glycine dehydrogenase subunit GcvPA [Peptoniphilaceae bacterium]|nr:aminomethyl-transferring glycine dehydrogenase subunit GcvPA [Peptoniphilaceae bacterium]MDD7383819.1 aminomethyl-transferring glycine dehydrogenase subunit GcvPA [Peptoniphilaceae bacterium]MDY3737604.1 aminomethyl-transferring glycine dehydrogenase subunit GcvPA [Peptoniphilaceae bacterium]